MSARALVPSAEFVAPAGAPAALRITRPLKAEPDAGPAWDLVAVGDVLLDAAGGGRRFRLDAPLAALLQSARIVAVNLEGPLAGSDPRAPKAGPHLALHPETLPMLVEWGATVACLANNHIFDYGPAALLRTAEACRRSNISTVGAGPDRRAALKPLVVEPSAGVRVALLNAAEWQFGVAEDEKPGHAWLLDPAMPQAILSAREQADVVILFAHAGAEDVPLPLPQLQAVLRSYVDLGVTLVIGHHPHVPQPWEAWNDGLICYSLGNFCFDYPAGRLGRVGEPGLAVRAEFRGMRLRTLDLIPIVARGEVVAPMETAQAEQLAAGVLEGAKVLSDAGALKAAWQGIAPKLLNEPYVRYMREALDMPSPRRTAYARRVLGELRRLAMAILNGPAETVARRPLSSANQQLLLLHLFRTESHRWVIETALSALAGEAEHRRTPERDPLAHRLAQEGPQDSGPKQESSG